MWQVLHAWRRSMWQSWVPVELRALRRSWHQQQNKSTNIFSEIVLPSINNSSRRKSPGNCQSRTTASWSRCMNDVRRQRTSCWNRELWSSTLTVISQRSCLWVTPTDLQPWNNRLSLWGLCRSSLPVVTSSSAMAETARETARRMVAEMCRVGDFKGVGHFEAKL